MFKKVIYCSESFAKVEYEFWRACVWSDTPGVKNANIRRIKPEEYEISVSSEYDLGLIVGWFARWEDMIKD